MKIPHLIYLYTACISYAFAGVSGPIEDDNSKAVWHGIMTLKPCIMVESPFSEAVKAEIDSYMIDTRQTETITIDIPENFTGRICSTSSFTREFNRDGYMELWDRFTALNGSPLTSYTKTMVKFNGSGPENEYWLEENKRNQLVFNGSLTRYTGDIVPDESTVEVNIYPDTAIAKVMQLCGVEGSSECVPFGSTNSGNWIARESAPTATFEDKPITLEKSQTIGFTIGAGAGYEFGKDSGPSLGLDISFGLSSTESSSQNLYTAYMTKTELRNDLGNTNTFKLSNNAIEKALEYASSDDYSRVINAEEAFGRNSWKNLPFSTRDTWTDTLKDSNCTPGQTKDILFLSKIGFKTTDSRFYQAYGGQSSIASVRVAMDCTKDKSGNLFRTKKIGLLN
ncbi:RNA-binding protein [Aeromonas schubertii]|uniref:hypothetical protein n=1 Tax=Aeromonas schubertii TaxID=652 RepID=UPI0010A769F8|nr:hypothetical protein [Aeromonas schubertii]QCG47277.1 hypothetical protein E2P79_04900 [Aeromonas schubertii]